jgi:hypothetical protein
MPRVSKAEEIALAEPRKYSEPKKDKSRSPKLPRRKWLAAGAGGRSLTLYLVAGNQQRRARRVQ